jgi:hypothetical protein
MEPPGACFPGWDIAFGVVLGAAIGGAGGIVAGATRKPVRAAMGGGAVSIVAANLFLTAPWSEAGGDFMTIVFMAIGGMSGAIAGAIGATAYSKHVG